MFDKVIVGFDGSDQARDALMLGATLVARDGKLLVCCVHRLKALSARIDQSSRGWTGRRPSDASSRPHSCSRAG